MQSSTLPTTTPVTYGTVLTMVQNWITSNCANVDTYANMGAGYKAASNVEVGRTYSRYHDGTPSNRGANQPYNCCIFRLNYASNVASKTTNNVIADLESFFSGLGLPSSKRNYPIDRKNLYNFLRDIAIFCSYKVCWAVTAVPPSLGSKYGNQGDTTNFSWTSQSSLGRSVVYSNATPSGGIALDPQPQGTPDTDDVTNGVINSGHRQHLLTVADITNMVTNILDNRYGRKTVTVTYTGSVVGF